MIEPLNFFDQSDLLYRLSYALKERRQEVVFLVGAALSAPMKRGAVGVPDANGVIDLIRAELTGRPGQIEGFDAAILADDRRRYQAAFRFLQGRLGQSFANEIVRKAVLAARLDSSGTASSAETEDDCRLLEFDPNWGINPGTDSLGKLLTHYPDRFGKALLTTNFDPLIEIAIRKAGGQCFKTTLHADGNLSQTEAGGSHIIHLHGYWYGSDTLHTNSQLQQSRPHLKASLASLLRNKLVVVSGYGGWDDIFTDALTDAVQDDSAKPEVLWTFYDVGPIVQEPLRARLLPGINRGRVSLYAGIDCNIFFPTLYDPWRGLETGAPPAKGTPTNSVRVSTSLQQVLKHKVLKPQILEGDDEDRPPIFDFCFGRERELRQLRESDARVIFLTGIGGQGKSTVAAKYFTDCQQSHSYDYFVWRDCKEEAERFENQLASVVETLSGGRVSGQDLAKQDAQSIVRLLLLLTGNRKVLFVFDNADHYINLETRRMTASPNMLIQELLNSETRSRVILTCRPTVNYQHLFALSCHLEGISLEATRELFAKRGAVCGDSEISEAHQLTDSHAFWLDLLSIQAAKSSAASFGSLVERIRSGGDNLPQNTLNSIWATLNERQQSVLRSMAETVRPETENEIGRYVQSKMNYHKAIRSLNVLRALNLVVVKRTPSGHDVLELHPLVRQFIRQKFSRPERSSFIEEIIKVYIRFIGDHKFQLEERPPLTTLQYWTQTAELDVAAGRIGEAFTTLSEVAQAFSISAYSREFSRVARLLLASSDWVSEHSKHPGFDEIFRYHVVNLENLGESAEVDRLLEMFEMTVLDRDARYIHYCEMKCHCKWIRGQFADAVKWGKLGQALKTSSNVDTHFDVAHSLALAERDAGQPELALPVFLEGRTLAEVIDPEELDEQKNGSHYGNVGRCLHFMGQIDPALACYQKSALLIEKDPQHEHVINQGYIRRWIGEVLIARNQFKLADAFLEAARLKWEQVSPPRAVQVALLRQQIEDQIPSSVEKFVSNDVERLFQDWISGRYMDAEVI
jgi:tetratricopeptide (TPR) repeat protein